MLLVELPGGKSVDGRKDQTLMKRRRGVQSEVSQSNYLMEGAMGANDQPFEQCSPPMLQRANGAMEALTVRSQSEGPIAFSICGVGGCRSSVTPRFQGPYPKLWRRPTCDTFGHARYVVMPHLRRYTNTYLYGKM